MPAMREPVIALAFTAEPWVEALHRHFTDHGGARIRQLVMDPAVALDDDYEVLVASARWPALTPGLVAELHDRHRLVLGVAGRDDHGSVDVLHHAGVDRVVMSDAAPIEFLEALLLLAPTAATPNHPRDSAPELIDTTTRIVVRGPGGSGATEVAIALAGHLATRAKVGLVDLDEVAPSIAQRLALPIEPNLRTAIDAIEYGIGEGVDEGVDGVDGVDGPAATASLRVVTGLPNAAAWIQVRAPEVERVIRAIARGRDCVIADIAAPLDDVGSATRSRYAIARMMIAQADVVVAVGVATPVGVTRLVTWLAEAHRLIDTATVHVVLNRAPKDAFRVHEIEAEFERCYQAASITTIPDDDAVARAMWAGSFVGRGAFTQATLRLAATINPVPHDARATRGRWRRSARMAVT
jgi:Mrp family chromosome partitioning ATPase